MDGILAEVLRGDLVESVHAGAAVIADETGAVRLAIGDPEQPVFPRSTVKALLAIDLVAGGAAERLHLTASELALACASHNGEPAHAETAARMLSRLDLTETCLECGAHWPTDAATARALAASGAQPGALHNNCSGKHAGLVCLACDDGHDPSGYISPEHPTMQRVTATLADITGVAHDSRNRGIDGCSIPTYAIPLRSLAQAFARFGTGAALDTDRAHACRTLREAVAAEPFMVAGTGRFDTIVMEALGARAFVKMGAEGVMVTSLPEQGLGIAIKVRDGGNRAAEVAMAALLARTLDTSRNCDQTLLETFMYPKLTNWRGIEVGSMRPAETLL